MKTSNKNILIWLVLAVVSSILLAVSYYGVFNTNHEYSIKEFQSSFLKLESELEAEVSKKTEQFSNLGIDLEWKKIEIAEDISIHVYRNDSLKFWNSNQLPILRFAEIHFPDEGLIHLQNGWYYSKIEKKDDLLICGSFLIKSDYSYENKELINDFAPKLRLPIQADLSLEQSEGLDILNTKGEFLFSILPNEFQEISSGNSVLLTLLLLVTFVIWARLAIKITNKVAPKYRILIPLLIVVARVLSIRYQWFTFLQGTEIFNPMLYGSSEWFPSFFDYLFNVTIFIYLLYELIGFMDVSRRLKRLKLAPLVYLIISFLVWEGIVRLLEGLVTNSTIPLAIEELFSLNFYSFLSIATIGALFYAYTQTLKTSFQLLRQVEIPGHTLAMLVFALGCFYLIFDLNFGSKNFVSGIFPMAFYGFIFYVVYLKKSEFKLGTGIVLLFMFSAIMAFNISDFNGKKELGERELYANEFATERSIDAEAEYISASEKIHEDKFLKRFISSPTELNAWDFKEGLERRVFNGFWDSYELKFNLFDTVKKSMLKDGADNFVELEKLISTRGYPSEINQNIYFIDDYNAEFNYVVKELIIGKDSTQAYLFCTMRSKKLPEEIGFPRLLISEDADVSEPLEKYSIAKFHDGNLITKYGDFDYPSAYRIMSASGKKKKGFYDYDGYNHFFLKRSPKDYLILSKQNVSSINLLTAFSYLFSFFGVLILPFLFKLNVNESIGSTFNLALKIQVVLISLVFISLMAFGWGSGKFVSTQYNEYTNDVIKEKLNSVETEVKAKLGAYDELSISENGVYMQQILQKFAKVFFTDINLYSDDGYLLATSRPKVFNKGLLSEQMNPEAYRNLFYEMKSEFVHLEKIGNLNYSSAYQPFYNKEGIQLGYINLQHFGQQREFENQIENFLVAIINVFILLLAVSIILAVFISNWLTEPLRILQESFASVQFGKHNERISYHREDEIGSLVREYNQKLDELEFTAEQLAKSERESAWREMAKQVAHEIKNPLTPMKLSVQQLLRTYDQNDPESETRIKKVADSIVEQIDALTKIANEFSNFAKMPQPTEEKVNVVKIIKGVKEVFGGQSRVKINIDSVKEELYSQADRNQLVRVFNNIIKNGIQSIPENRKGVIDVRITADENIRIEISDNGSGIPEEMVNKIFVPYFTTKNTGTGLGLAMVKQIVENHNGTINFESAPNHGTTFFITLPLVD